MSETSSVPSIQLAQRFIHIVDFHADPITCISASSGTVSYDSVISVDAAANPTVPRAFRQPPHPHGVVRVRNMMRGKTIHQPVAVDLEMFRKVKEEQRKRNKQVTKESVTVADWKAANKEMGGRMKACLDNFRKSLDDETRKAVFDITIEVPMTGKGMVMTQRTVSRKTWEERHEAADPRKHVDKVFRAIDLN